MACRSLTTPAAEGPYQHDVISEKGGIEFPSKDVGGRNELVATRYRVVEPNAAGSICQYRQLSDADCRQSGLFAKPPLGVCTSRTADIAGRAEGDPERLGGERRIRLFAEPQNQRNPAKPRGPNRQSG